MSRLVAASLAALALLGPAVRAETVCQPGHRTWTNSYVPPHCDSGPDRRYVAPRNQPLDTATAPDKPATPPVSVFTPAPQYDPYYGALGAALGPTPLRPRSQNRPQ